MKNMLAMVLASLGTFIASISTTYTPLWFMDEPTCPKSLIEK